MDLMKTTMTTGFQELGRKILDVINASHATTPEVDTSCGNATYPLFNGDCDVITGTKPPTCTSQVYHNVNGQININSMTICPDS